MHLTTRLLLLIGVTPLVLALLTPTEAFAQAEPIGQPPVDRVYLEGSDLHHCLMTIRYFKGRQPSKAVTLKLSFVAGAAGEPIEPGYDGVEVYVQSAKPVRLQLVGQDTVITEEVLSEPGVARSSSGKVGRGEFKLPPIELAEADERLITDLLTAAVEAKSTQPLIADIEGAQVDGPCLDVFFRELQSRLGPIKQQDLSQQGWIGWQNDQKARVLSGVIELQQGRCGLQLTVQDGKLTNVSPNCPELPDDVIDEPIQTDSYIVQSSQLVKKLFAGDASAAHQLYAAQFRQQVTVDQLNQLSQTLREKHGDRLLDVQFKRTLLQPYNFAQKNKLLLVDLIASLEGGARCNCRVVFNINTGRDRVGKASLGAINVTRTLASAQPKIAELTGRMIQSLPRGIQIKSLMPLVYSGLRPVIEESAWQETFDRLKAQFQDQQPQVDLDLWSLSESQNQVQVSGPVQYGQSDCLLEIQFIDDQLLSLSFYGPATAESTAGQIKFDPLINQTAKTFWANLLRADASAAHAMLDKSFQEQFSLDQLKEQLAAPESKNPAVKGLSVKFVRLSTQTNRPVPLMATVFLQAEFADGSRQPVACEVAWPRNNETAIYDFTNEVEVDFPVSKIPVAGLETDGAELAAAAFRMHDASKLIQLISPDRRKDVDQAALTAYLKQLELAAGSLKSPSALARTVEFHQGTERYRCNFVLLGEMQQNFPIEVWFDQGHIQRFAISHPKLAQFTEQLKDTANIESRLSQFVKNWMSSDNRPIFVTASLQSAEGLDALKNLREQFQQECQDYQSHSISNPQPVEGSNFLEYEVTLKGMRASKQAKILMDIGAFGGLVSTVTFQ